MKGLTPVLLQPNVKAVTPTLFTPVSITSILSWCLSWIAPGNGTFQVSQVSQSLYFFCTSNWANVTKSMDRLSWTCRVCTKIIDTHLCQASTTQWSKCTFQTMRGVWVFMKWWIWWDLSTLVFPFITTWISRVSIKLMQVNWGKSKWKEKVHKK